jgi:hypothetical protein
MKLGLVNAISFCAREYKICAINAYFPAKGGTGPATLNTSISQFQQTSAQPAFARRQTPIEFVRSMTQRLISQRRLKGYTVVLGGDLNDTASAVTFKTFVAATEMDNPLAHAFGRDPLFHTRFSNSEKQRNTAIDHILHTPLPDGLAIQQVGVINTKQSILTASDSDHYPIWINLKLTRPFTVVQPRKPLPIPPRCDIGCITAAVRANRKGENWDEHVLYNDLLLKHIRAFPPHSLRKPDRCIAALLRLSVEVTETGPGLEKKRKSRARGGNHKVQSRRKNGFSPVSAAIGAHMEFYHQLSTIAFPPGRTFRNPRWQTGTYQSSLEHWLRKWRKRHCTVLAATKHHPLITKQDDPGHLAYMSIHQITHDLLQSRIKALKAVVHGSQRDELRRQSNAEIRKVGKLHDQRELGKVIRLLSGKPVQHLDLQTLQSNEHGLLSNHFVIQRELNQYFHDWMCIPSTLDPAAEHMARHPYYWHTLLHIRDPTAPTLLNQHSRIPADQQKGLRRVCAKKVSAAVEAKVRAAENAPITIADFDKAINEIANGGAPGLSGATANMVKGWNAEVRLFAYEHMHTLWTLRAEGIPQWIKDKKVKLAPKQPGNAALTNMRPISLYEVIRKVWTTTVAKRIHQVLHDESVLHDAQGGYRLEQGTMMPLLQVINQIEDASHKGIEKHLTFWDIRRAFDSIPRNFQLLAWTRMGVSKETAQWFVQMDDGGLSFLDTPLYAADKQLHSHQEMLAGKSHMSSTLTRESEEGPATDLFFTPERGIGQGESASSLQWTLLYDILLEWIDPRNRHLHVDENLEAYDDVTARDAAPFAYADDLATISSGTKGEYMLQLQATWLSSFCAFAGLVIHPGKIKSTVVGKVHDRHLPRPQADGSLIYPSQVVVYDHQWKPISCPIDTEMDTYKYLGVNLDLRGRTRASFNRLYIHAEALLSNLLIAKGPVQAKVDYIRFKIMPEVLYTAQVSNWSLSEYRRLDRPFTATYRKLLSLPRTSPNTIIYLPNKYCGVGLPRVSDLAQRYKWNHLLRCQAIGGSLQTCMNQLLRRVPSERHPLRTPIEVIQPRHQGVKGAVTPFQRGARYLARSILEWTAEMDMVIARRSYEDSQEVRDRQTNCTTIEKFARAARLWPDPELYGEEQELLSVQSYFTDGSFTTTMKNTADILADDRALQRVSHGSGGLAIIPQDPLHPVLGFHVKSATPQPGMTAYTWELVMQVVGLHMMKHMPSDVHGYSDCQSALTRCNTAMQSRRDMQTDTTAGILTSGAFEFRPAEEGKPDPHMKRADPGLARLIQWIRSHPERDKSRYSNPSPEDIGIFLADLIAANAKEHETVKSLGNTRLPPMEVETMVLHNIMNEIIPMYQWHLRSAVDTSIPILDDPLEHQHSVQLAAMTKLRDTENEVERWTTTSLAFAAKVHPPKDPSYWAAARRALIVFDWMGHGRNRAKLSSLSAQQKIHEAKCRHCRHPDSQEHGLLECTHEPLTAIRNSAKVKQAVIADRLLNKYDSKRQGKLRHFIREIKRQCWNPDTPDLSRLWIGTWSPSTLERLLQQGITAPLTRSNRHLYISIAEALTKPLLEAHDGILRAAVAAGPLHPHGDDHLPLLDHIPADTHKNAEKELHSSHPLMLTRAFPSLLRQELEATHIQLPPGINNGPSLHNTHSLSSSYSAFSVSDAALLREPAAGAF